MVYLLKGGDGKSTGELINILINVSLKKGHINVKEG
jgi:hypothetical protein